MALTKKSAGFTVSTCKRGLRRARIGVYGALTGAGDPAPVMSSGNGWNPNPLIIATPGVPPTGESEKPMWQTVLLDDCRV